MKKDKLLPCPFCGNDAELIYHEPSHRVIEHIIECKGCGAASLLSSNKNLVIENWNKRTGNKNE